VSDETERPEDTVRRFAGQVQELLDWQRRYRTAAELWDALVLDDNDQVTEAVLVAKVADFARGGTAVSLGATDGCDWVIQLGLLHGALQVMDANPPERAT
jgi:hypothetical protein